MKCHCLCICSGQDISAHQTNAREKCDSLGRVETRSHPYRLRKGGSHGNRSIKSRVMGISRMTMAIKKRIKAYQSFCGRRCRWRSQQQNMSTGYQSKVATKRQGISFKGPGSVLNEGPHSLNIDFKAVIYIKIRACRGFLSMLLFLFFNKMPKSGENLLKFGVLKVPKLIVN